MIKAIGGMIDKLLAGPPQKFQGVMGIYSYVDDATKAVHALHDLGHKNLSVFSPVPYHDLEHAQKQGPSLVRWVTFGGAMLGVTGGFALCIYSVYSYPLVVGGKELLSLPPFVTIGYESMILIGALANLVGMLALGRLPAVKSKAPYDPRFTEDRIGIWVPCSGSVADKVRDAMNGQGAEEVHVHA
jgi:hypothetical protein